MARTAFIEPRAVCGPTASRPVASRGGCRWRRRDADVPPSGAAAVVDDGPGVLQQQLLLRVHLLRLAHGDAEEPRVEAVDPGDERAGAAVGAGHVGAAPLEVLVDVPAVAGISVKASAPERSIGHRSVRSRAPGRSPETATTAMSPPRAAEAAGAGRAWTPVRARAWLGRGGGRRGGGRLGVATGAGVGVAGVAVGGSAVAGAGWGRRAVRPRIGWRARRPARRSRRTRGRGSPGVTRQRRDSSSASSTLMIELMP